VAPPRRPEPQLQKKKVSVTNVLICDERRSARDGLTKVMAALPSIGTIDTVSDGDELLTRYGREAADIVLIGTQRALTGGIEATRRLLAVHPNGVVIVFGSPDDTASIAAAIACGARGFLRWDATQPEIIAALADTVSSPRLPSPRASDDSQVNLTERELQVLRGMSQGQSNGEIGRELFLSEDTVKTHARRLFRKLGARDRAQAVAVGFRRGLVA
jgi:DNA-binding NarL/FixJ family response regulator